MTNFILIDNNKPREVISFGHWSLNPIDFVHLSGNNQGTVQKCEGFKVDGYEKTIDIPEHKILSFWDKMDEINVWSWESSYEHPEIKTTDGHMWSLELKNRNGRTVKTEGNNYYPKEYNKFIKSLNYLFGSEINQIYW